MFPFFEKAVSIRAMVVDDAGSVWLSGSDGVVAVYGPSGLLRERQIVFDTIRPDFRSMAQTSDAVFVLSAGRPALLYKIDKNSMKARLVFRDDTPGTFYDALKFVDNRRGVAVGDAVNGFFSVLITGDGGETWKPVKAGASLAAQEGEACFAASNSGLAANDEEIWFASGGSAARLFHSTDFGRHWENFITPVLQGSQMEGIFSMDVTNDEIVIAGGNYEKRQSGERNLAFSRDGGKNWQLVETPFGYVSCISYIEDRAEGHWICATASGIFETTDAGKKWERISPEFFNVVVPGNGVLFVGGKEGASKILRQ